MPRLDRTSQGVIFFDDFNNSAALDRRWVVTPSLSSRYSLVEKAGYMRVKHAESSTYIVTDIPDSNEFMLEMKNEYKPMVSNDMGGLVVYKTHDDRVELVEYYDSVLDASKNYLYLRIVRDGNVYDGYGSQDSVIWELIGSARIEDAAKVGIVLNGMPNALTVNLDIDYMAMWTDRFLYVENLQENMKVRLYDKTNKLIQEQVVAAETSILKFDMFTLPLPFIGYIELYSPSGILLYKTVTEEINPGDEFQYIMDIEVNFSVRVFSMGYDADGKPALLPKFISNSNLQIDSTTFVGNMSGSTIEGVVTVKNNDPEDIRALQATIELYTNDYNSNIVQMAYDNYGEPGDYQDMVVFDVPAKSSYFFWMKISTSNVPALSKHDMFKYKLVLKNA